MKRSILFLIFVSVVAHAQLWTGVISSSRAIDWSQAGVVGGIPDANWTQNGSVSACGTSGSPVSAATCGITAALAACGTNHYVAFGAGTYHLNSAFTIPSNCVARGAGADQTIIKFHGGSCGYGTPGLVCFTNGDGTYQYSYANYGTWTASGYTPGQTTITLTLGGGTAPSAGELMVLFQSDPASDPSQIWNCAGISPGYVCSDEQQPGQVGPNSAQGSAVCNPQCSQVQTVTVANVTGSGPYTVTISPGLYSPIWANATYCASGGCTVGAYWSSTLPTTNAGLENMTLDNSAMSNGNGSLVQFLWAKNDWMTGVRTINGATSPARNNVWLIQAVHNTLQNNYAYGSNGSDLSYGYESGYQSSDNLFANNIFQHVATAAIINGGQGDVYIHNYCTDNYYTAGGSAPNFQQVCWYGGHSNGSYLNLYESNVGGKGSGDIIHGTSWMTTYYRNYMPGRDGVFKNSSTMAFDNEAFDRYYNIVANVFGYPGWTSAYTFAASSSTDNSNCNSTGETQSVYTLGYSQGNACDSNATVINDTLVATYLYRWANWDVYNAATQYNTGEVPSALSAYAQPVPTSACTASLSCPNSFYYSSQPSYWSTTYGTPPWPAIGPDVTGGSVPNLGGHVNQIPAQLVFGNLANDSNYAVTDTGSITESGSTATLTLGTSAPASFAQYQSFWLTGCSVSGYNTLWQIATVSGTTLTFTATSGLSSATGCTATVNAIKVFNANVYQASSPASSAITGKTKLKGNIIIK